LFRLFRYNDPNTFIDEVAKSIIDNRLVNNPNKVIGADIMNDFIFSKREEAEEFLINNKLLLALYIYSMVTLIFFKTK